MKKTLLTLGSIASMAAPIIAVVSCGSNDTKTEKGLFAKYNMKSIYDLASKKRTELDELIKPEYKELTYTQFEGKVNASTVLTPSEKSMINEIMAYYQDKTTHKVTTGWHVLHFAIMTTDDMQIAMAVMGWNDSATPDGIDNDEAVKQYILSGTINIDEMVHTILEKFRGHDSAHFKTTISDILTVDDDAKTLTGDCNDARPGVIANMTIGAVVPMTVKAMAGEETLSYLLKHSKYNFTLKILNKPATTSA